MSTKARILAGSILATTLVSAAALLVTSRPVTAISTEAALRERVKLFWDSRVSGDWVKNYELMSPDMRDEVSMSDYVSTKGFISYYSYEIELVEATGATGQTRVRYSWRANHPAFAKASAQAHTMEDDWVLIDGTWFKKYVPPSLGTPQPPSSPWDDSDQASGR